MKKKLITLCFGMMVKSGCELVKLSPSVNIFDNQNLITYITCTAFDIISIFKYSFDTCNVYHSILDESLLNVSNETNDGMFKFLRSFYHIALYELSLRSIIHEKVLLEEKIMLLNTEISKENEIPDVKKKKLDRMQEKKQSLEESEKFFVGCMTKYFNKYIKQLVKLKDSIIYGMSEEKKKLRNELAGMIRLEGAEELGDDEKEKLEIISRKIERLENWEGFYNDLVNKYSKLMFENED